MRLDRDTLAFLTSTALSLTACHLNTLTSAQNGPGQKRLKSIADDGYLGDDPFLSEAIHDVPSCTPLVPVNESNLNTAYDLTYATIAGQTLKLDIAYPKDDDVHPLVVLVHGGGFTAGDKHDKRSDLLMLAGQGYAAASINYRLAKDKTTHFPAQVQDARCAIRWLRAHADTYHLDAKRVAAEGDSAGGTIVAMLGTTDDSSPFDSPDCATSPQAATAAIHFAIGNAGRTDVHLNPAITPVAAAKIVTAYLGFDPRAVSASEAEARIDLASPLTHVSASSAAFLLFHGQADPLVETEQYQTFSQALKAVGVPVLFIDEPRWTHAPPILSPDPTYRHSLCTSLDFLNRALRP